MHSNIPLKAGLNGRTGFQPVPNRPTTGAFWEFDVVVPEGRHENSPAFQRWVLPWNAPKSRRDDRNPNPKPGFLSSLRDSFPIRPQPSVETLGYSRKSLRDKLLSEFPKGIRPSLVRPTVSLKARKVGLENPRRFGLRDRLEACPTFVLTPAGAQPVEAFR